MNSRLEIKRTADGSNTIFLPDLNENYHSFHGAIQEANHVFIKNGLDQFTSTSEITIFELGFGTGLNALLTCMWAEKNKVKIEYVSIEAFPVPINICKKMDYPVHLDPSSPEAYSKLLEAEWEQLIPISTHFSIRKINSAIQEWTNNQKFDLIYFDAFGPRAQSEMWELPILEKMFNSLEDNGILVTYCAQGQFRRNLKYLGFNVESLPGPPGKREMTCAHKN
ncbi:MAG: tRNA (5-methylaminomethyl-2-thiouridine)(34)-methyltransferase MnmD [Crocinitomicaceae bacterium]